MTFRFLSALFEPKPSPEPQLTVEQGWAARRAELEARLREIESEQAELTQRWQKFRAEHAVLVGRRLEYCGGEAMRGAHLMNQEMFFHQEFTTLKAARDKILGELAPLLANPNESTHVEGKAVTVHA